MKLKTFVTFLLGIGFYISNAQQTSGCVYDLALLADETITARLIGINSSMVDAAKIRQSIGIYIPCDFSYDNKKFRRPIITSKRFSLKRNGKVAFSVITAGAYWTDSIRRELSHVLPGDSLIFDQISAVVELNDAVIKLDSIPSLTFAPLIVAIVEPSLMPDLETKFDLAMDRSLSFIKLRESYSSGENLDASFIIFNLTQKMRGDGHSRRYLFKIANETKYDFTFFADFKWDIVEVFDNIKMKKYSMTEWEILISKKAKL